MVIDQAIAIFIVWRVNEAKFGLNFRLQTTGSRVEMEMTKKLKGRKCANLESSKRSRSEESSGRSAYQPTTVARYFIPPR